MAPRRSTLSTTATLILAVACADPTTEPIGVAPSFHRDGGGHRAVVVDPDGRHDATTIQAGIDLASPGGRVRVMRGTYAEVLVINKGLTLEGTDRGDDDHHRNRADQRGQVVIAPSGAPLTVIEVTTSQPVTIRDVTVHVGGTNGIRGVGVVDLTVERATVVAVNPPLGMSLLVAVLNDAPTTGRARLVVKNSFIDGAVPFANSPTPAFPQSFGVRAAGDVDALVDGNVIRRTGGACINIQARNDLAGHMQADITDNDVDECYPLGRAGSINVTPANTNVPSATRPVTATGVVNIVGNTIRNSFASSLPSTAILQTIYAGRIEHNRIIGVVQPGAIATVRGAPGAILIGDQRDFFPPTGVIVRFNDIVGNAQAGLRVGKHETASLDARCNYWGSEDGPSGVGSGTGDAVLVETGGARPVLAPFATGPIARHRHHGHHDDDDDKDGHDRGRCHLDFSLWSAPVNLGATINTAGSESNPALSPDALSLYFQSTRPGGLGGSDLWVSRRATISSPWEAPVNLGPTVNSASNEFAPNLSTDGDLLFFASNRPGGRGLNDIYRSHRANVQDDFGWDAPVALSPDVNTSDADQAPEYWQRNGRGPAILFLTRGPTVPAQDIYMAPLTRDGEPSAPAVLVPELSDPTANDAAATVRPDGREIVFFSTRVGVVGGSDLWVSTRRSVRDPWSTPVNMGVPVNAVGLDQQASLADEGRTLLLSSDRPGGVGSLDIWISTRTRIHH